MYLSSPTHAVWSHFQGAPLCRWEPDPVQSRPVLVKGMWALRPFHVPFPATVRAEDEPAALLRARRLSQACTSCLHTWTWTFSKSVQQQRRWQGLRCGYARSWRSSPLPQQSPSVSSLVLLKASLFLHIDIVKGPTTAARSVREVSGVLRQHWGCSPLSEERLG